MAKHEFKVGDRVRFKEWVEMGKEFGFCTDGDINTKCLFKKEMRHFCGTYATIANLIPFAGHHLVILCNFTTNGNTRWNITTDMLKPASTKKQTVAEPKKLETTYPTITAHTIEGKKTTVMLSDGRIGEVTCYYKDTFDPAVGVAEAYKKALGIAIKSDKQKVVEVKRKAKIGEWVKVIGGTFKYNPRNREMGDIIHIDGDEEQADTDGYIWGSGMSPKRNSTDDSIKYVVLENYVPEKSEDKPKPKIKEVKRKAKTGEWVKVVNAKPFWALRSKYHNGDILQIINDGTKHDFGLVAFSKVPCSTLMIDEYVVLEGYEPPKAEKPKTHLELVATTRGRKLGKVGDCTPLKTSNGIKLQVGDVVLVTRGNESHKKPVVKEETSGEAFIMGFRHGNNAYKVRLWSTNASLSRGDKLDDNYIEVVEVPDENPVDSHWF